MKLIERFAADVAKIGSPTFRRTMTDIEVIEYGAQWQGKIDPAKTIFIGDEVPTSEIFKIFQKHKVRHFVQKNREDFFYDLFASVLMLKMPAQLMRNPFPLLMANYSPKAAAVGTQMKTVDFKRSKEKNKVLERVEHFLSEDAKTKRLSDAVLTMADEMIANALYNGPVGSTGRPLFSEKDRREEVEYSFEQSSARIFLCNDGQRLLVGCRDPFGSVQESAMIAHLASLYGTSDRALLRRGRAGAGIGCKLMIDQAAGFYVLVNQRKQTLVCCSIPLGMNRARRERLEKNIHFCTYRG